MKETQLIQREFEYFTTEESSRQDRERAERYVKSCLEHIHYAEKLIRDLSGSYLEKVLFQNPQAFDPKVRVKSLLLCGPEYVYAVDKKWTVEGQVKDGERIFHTYLAFDFDTELVHAACECLYFHKHGVCRHTLALARRLSRE